MKKFLNIAFVITFVFPLVANGQVREKIEEAYTQYKNENYSTAAQYIDEAVAMDEGKTNKIAWHIRGFIYKDIFLSSDDSDTAENARNQAVTSFKNSIKYDEDKALEVQNREALRFLAVSFFNEASQIIENRNPETVESANGKYLRFKKLMTYLNPDSLMNTKDIEFYLAMSTAHRKIYESDREAYSNHWEISNDYLMRVLDIDPKSWPANYSLAVSNYNKGAYNLERLPEVTNIPDIYEIQAESMRSIEVALPYMMKAYKINPEKREAVNGLRVIYFNLNLEKESEKMRLKGEELEEFQNK